MRTYIALTCALALAGCGQLPWQGSHAPRQMAPSPLGPTPAAAPAALDRTTTAQMQAALSAKPARGQRQLGETVASLGDPARPGFWLRTPLVKTEQKGRIALRGKSLEVQLLPGTGPRTGASQLSLAAFRALGLELTDLPKITVYGP